MMMVGKGRRRKTTTTTSMTTVLPKHPSEYSDQ